MRKLSEFAVRHTKSHHLSPNMSRDIAVGAQPPMEIKRNSDPQSRLGPFDRFRLVGWCAQLLQDTDQPPGTWVLYDL